MARKKAAAHGGAWKVAYADFVTAMMALFMVLWISAQDKKILIATSRYFQSPFRSPLEDHSGVMPFNKDQQKASTSEGKEPDAAGTETPSSSRQVEFNFLNSVASDLVRMLNLDQDLANKPIDVQVTSDGLRITLFNRSRQPLFVDDTTEFTPWGRFIMQSLAWMIDRHKFRVNIDGHTRAKLELKRENYTAWELSADRANAARRDLVHYAVDPGMIERVTGYADTQPLPGMPPESDSNQRITISLSLGKKAAAGSSASATASPPAADTGKKPAVSLFPLKTDSRP